MIPRVRRAALAGDRRGGAFQMVAVGALNLARITGGWRESREYRVPYDTQKLVLLCYLPHPVLAYARNTTLLWPRAPRLQLEAEPLPDEPALVQFGSNEPLEERLYPNTWEADTAPIVEPIRWSNASFSYQESGHPAISTGTINIDQAYGQPLWSTTYPLIPTVRQQQTTTQTYTLEFYPIGPHRIELELPYPIGTNRVRVRFTLWEGDLVRIGSLQKGASWGSDPVPIRYRLFSEGRS